jgi:ribosomal protein L11 methyltransferase
MSGFSITLNTGSADRDRLIAELWAAGTTGIVEDEDWVRAFFDEGSDRRALVKQFVAFEPRVEDDDDRDWVQHAQSMWRSFPVGERFYLVPEWLNDPAPCGRVRLRIRPGLACGSGAHQATQLCLQALEHVEVEGRAVLDVGTGSGILSEAATLIGASSVFGCDIDHEATLVARRNLDTMPVRPALFTGSLKSVRSASVDVIVGNLNAATLNLLAGEMLRVARSTVIVSGFREREAEQVVALFSRPVQRHLEMDDWTCLIF